MVLPTVLTRSRLPARRPGQAEGRAVHPLRQGPRSRLQEVCTASCKQWLPQRRRAEPAWPLPAHPPLLTAGRTGLLLAGQRSTSTRTPRSSRLRTSTSARTSTSTLASGACCLQPPCTGVGGKMAAARRAAVVACTSGGVNLRSAIGAHTVRGWSVHGCDSSLCCQAGSGSACRWLAPSLFLWLATPCADRARRRSIALPSAASPTSTRRRRRSTTASSAAFGARSAARTATMASCVPSSARTCRRARSLARAA